MILLLPTTAFGGMFGEFETGVDVVEDSFYVANSVNLDLWRFRLGYYGRLVWMDSEIGLKPQFNQQYGYAEVRPVEWAAVGIRHECIYDKTNRPFEFTQIYFKVTWTSSSRND